MKASNCQKQYQQKKGKVLSKRGGSTVRSAKAPISCLNNPSEEICCLSGAHVQDIRERLACMIKLEEYCPFLIFQCGSSEAATRKLENIKRLYIPWEEFEEIRITGSILLSPPRWKLGTSQK